MDERHSHWGVRLHLERVKSRQRQPLPVPSLRRYEPSGQDEDALSGYEKIHGEALATRWLGQEQGGPRRRNQVNSTRTANITLRPEMKSSLMHSVGGLGERKWVEMRHLANIEARYRLDQDLI